jgi:hypothetical protein
MQKFRSLVLFFLAFQLSAFGQYNGLGFAYPIDRNPVVTGNYAELRPNHFHAGVDFSTDPKINLPIKSVADGYISRIKISSGGYGRVLYVTHPNGYVTVYAHQKRYADRINSYARHKQLEQKKNEIELFPSPNELPVKKGEIIGYTGNTGSSTGPHLHFEIREEKSELPLNPLLFYDIKDDIKPVLTHVAIYNTSDTNAVFMQKSVAFNPKLNSLNLSGNTFLLPQNTFALAFAGYDLTNGTTNKNNIYEAKIELDGRIIYHHQLNTISFDDARYVNVFSEKVGSIKYQKCFTPACYNISIYKSLINGGKIELKDTLPHVLELTVSDEKGNHNNLVFYVKAKTLTGYVPSATKNNAFCAKESVLKQTSYEMIIPAGALANNAYIRQLVFIKASAGGGIEIGNKKEPLMKPYKMALKIPVVQQEIQSKLVMLVNDDVLNGHYADGWLRAEPKALGNFKYAYDTVAPVISYPLSKSKTIGLNGRPSVSFKISDAMSGIGSYDVFINDTWQIAEYDAKSATLTCYFDEQTPKGNIHIRVTATDRVGNTFSYDVYTTR